MTNINYENVNSFDCYVKNDYEDYAYPVYGEDIELHANYCEIFMNDGSIIILDNNLDIIDFVNGFVIYNY